MDPIHHRRRWYYVLWSVLLLLSAGALVLWETPARTELASLQVLPNIMGAPGGSRLQVWAGPQKRWPGSAWSGQGAFADVALPGSGAAAVPLMRVPIARRRWIQDYLPRGTWDLVMLRVVPPSGPARFFALPLAGDIRSGLLRSKRRLTASIDVSWENLKVDADPANRVP